MIKKSLFKILSLVFKKLVLVLAIFVLMTSNNNKKIILKNILYLLSNLNISK